MTPQRSWTDRVLPEWLGGSPEPGRGRAGRGGHGGETGQEQRRLLERIAQLREGLEGALVALPEEEAEAGRKTREAADRLVARARAAVDALEEAGDGAGGGRGPDAADALPPLREGARALHEAHFRTIKMRVARDHGDEEEAAAAREGLPECLEALDGASSSLAELLGLSDPPPEPGPDE